MDSTDGDPAASLVELGTMGERSTRVMRHWPSEHHELPSITAKTEVRTVSPIRSDNLTDSELTSWGLRRAHRVEYVACSERRKREFEVSHVQRQLGSKDLIFFLQRLALSSLTYCTNRRTTDGPVARYQKVPLMCVNGSPY
jgi:hypothetical protein